MILNLLWLSVSFNLITSFTHLWVLGLKDDAGHGKDYSYKEAQLHTDQSRGWHGDHPNYGVISARTPLSRNIPELSECPPKANNDDGSQHAFLESLEERCKEEEHKEYYQGADQTGYLCGEKGRQTEISQLRSWVHGMLG